ncbi:uncharacterized protein L203_106401 [Cryptococcus depauperatus CBS 7841]|uniref:Uncharacterized protein n=1 Tax=Cryptococcus depauperatus CBS 7841 TaxID=1295531 RepID=A0A1E3IJ22_9TREE|nr:hypothetical protein L203_02596 [Cryptococcus depauperatus CBS 7841]
MSNPGGRQGGSNSEQRKNDLTQYSLTSSNFSVSRQIPPDHLSSVSSQWPSGDGQTAQPQYPDNQGESSTGPYSYTPPAGQTYQPSAESGMAAASSYNASQYTASGGNVSTAAPQRPYSAADPEVRDYFVALNNFAAKAKTQIPKESWPPATQHGTLYDNTGDSHGAPSGPSASHVPGQTTQDSARPPSYFSHGGVKYVELPNPVTGETECYLDHRRSRN